MTKQPVTPGFHYLKHFGLLAVLFFAIPAGNGEAQQPSGGGRSFLWAVEGKENTVFLAGSLHLATPDFYPLGGAIEKAYADSGMIVLETDPRGEGGAAAQEKILNAGVYLDGTTLRDHVSRGTYEALAGKARALGLPAEQLQRFKPWLCAITLTASALDRLGFDARYGIDRHFLRRAQKDGKMLGFLESPGSQVDLLASLDAPLQEAFLVKTIVELDLVERMYLDLVSAWKRGDAKRFEDFMAASFESYPKIYERFVLWRNMRWMDQIEAFLEMKKDVMVMAGSGHFVGRDGIVRALEERGYKVSQR